MSEETTEQQYYSRVQVTNLLAYRALAVMSLPISLIFFAGALATGDSDFSALPAMVSFLFLVIFAWSLALCGRNWKLARILHSALRSNPEMFRDGDAVRHLRDAEDSIALALACVRTGPLPNPAAVHYLEDLLERTKTNITTSEHRAAMTQAALLAPRLEGVRSHLWAPDTPPTPAS